VFDFLLSEERKTRHHATNWLEVAERVDKFRRDQLTAAQLDALRSAAAELRRLVQERAEAKKLKAAVEKLEGVLRTTGGRHYPVSSMVENVEFFLVAAIVILGLRAYFVQPFKIPTNSMYPTYYGMKGESYAPAVGPGWVRQAGRLLAYGAIHHAVIAPADGEVMVPVFPNSRMIPYAQTAGRTLLVFPSVDWEYTLMVDGETVHVDVPADFNEFDRMLDEQCGHGPGGWLAGIEERIQKMDRPLETSMMNLDSSGQRAPQRVVWVPLGKRVRKGEEILSFDVLTGDLLFVDRISYNFFRPQVGQGFVFKTENIHSPEMERPPGSGNQIKSYYIKRLVGRPGDTLEVKAPVLWRNGKPIDGAAAFQKNAVREGVYSGYTNTHALEAGATVTVGPHEYFAMGDNSPVSDDSRYWGGVPEKDVVGRPLFIYYPLSRRWGPAR